MRARERRYRNPAGDPVDFGRVVAFARDTGQRPTERASAGAARSSRVCQHPHAALCPAVRRRSTVPSLHAHFQQFVSNAKLSLQLHFFTIIDIFFGFFISSSCQNVLQKSSQPDIRVTESLHFRH